MQPDDVRLSPDRRQSLMSVGIAAAIGPARAAAVAAAAEAAGFRALWVNDTAGADALTLLEAAAAATTRLTVATGVLPVDRRTADDIIARVEQGRLPQERLMLGIGSGRLAVGALHRVGEVATQLRSALSARVVVGALGPRMRRLAVTDSDGVLLSWLTPATAAAQSAEAHAASSAAHVALYVRAALDGAAGPRLSAESSGYAAIGSYARNFARQSASPRETVLDAAAGGLIDRLTAYRSSVDEVVLRMITPEDNAREDLRFIDTAQALL